MMTLLRLFWIALAFIPLAACAENNGEIAQGDSLPKILIIGDSISVGYTPPLAEILKGRAVVEHNPGNARDTSFGLIHLDEWLGEENWDVIHFNHGLHDLKYVDEDGKNTRSKEAGRIQVPLDEYAENLEAIVERLKETGARLIFATTTPFPENPDGPLREREDVVKYNQAALGVMKKHGVLVNNLYSFTSGRLAQLQRPNNVHFTQEGSAALAEETARLILEVLKDPQDQ